MPDLPPARLHERIEHDFTNHAPANDEIIRRFEALREEAKAFAHLIVDTAPQSREQSLALTHVEQALMYAVAAVARNQEVLGA